MQSAKRWQLFDLKNTYERRDLALCQGIVLVLPGRTNHVLQAIAPAVDLAAGHLYSPQVLLDAYHGVQLIARHCTHPARELTLLIIGPPIPIDRHD
ncbi:hypothetical protein BH23ACT11_BH23ACT11_26800 [soil metagenome]